MVYVWSWPKGIPDRYHLDIDFKRSPNYGDVSKGGGVLPNNFGTLHFACKADQTKLRRLHVLPVGVLRIISPDVRQVLELHAKDCVQFIPVEIQTRDGICRDFTALHVLAVVGNEHIDDQRSYFEDGKRFDPNGEKKDICHAFYKENCLGESPIAVSNIWFEDMLVSDALRQELSVFPNNGLVTQEEAATYFLKFSSSSPYAVKGADWKDC